MNIHRQLIGNDSTILASGSSLARRSIVGGLGGLCNDCRGPHGSFWTHFHSIWSHLDPFHVKSCKNRNSVATDDIVVLQKTPVASTDDGEKEGQAQVDIEVVHTMGTKPKFKLFAIVVKNAIYC